MNRILLFAFVLLAGCQYVVESPIVDETPAAWPCGALHYTIDVNSGSAQQRQDVHDIMWEVGLLTNRYVAFDGYTQNPSGSARGKIHYRWADVGAGKRGWADADYSADSRWIVGADVLIAPSAANHRAVVAHETGHAFGLGHVSDSGQVMYDPVLTYVWGQGDMLGLQAVEERCN